MPKKQTIVKVNGYTKAGILAKTHNASEVRSFRNAKGSIKVTSVAGGNVLLHTHKGVYILRPAVNGNNLYTGRADDIIIHFTKKKLVGKVIYWS
jgi:hypothetical protein